MDLTDREELRKVYPVLQSLSPALLTRVEQLATPVHAPAGIRVFEDGGPCTGYPLLLEGHIRVSKSGSDGHELLLYVLNPGESCLLTVAALLGEAPFPAVGTAATPLSAFSVPRPVFLEMILESPVFRAFVFSALAQRMAHLMAVVEDVAFHRVDRRLAAHLLLIGHSDSLTHQRLADELGTSREVVSRILEHFQQAGMVKLGRKHIEIVNPQALQRFHQVGA